MRLRSWHAHLPTSGYIAAIPCTMAVKMAFINGAQFVAPAKAGAVADLLLRR